MGKEELDRGREEGLRRYRIIAPLLEEGLAESEKRPIRRLVCDQEGISERTLRRYVAAFNQGGFDDLIPRERKDKGSCKAITPKALELAGELRQELPGRSAKRIQELLSSEGYNVARSTLERHLRAEPVAARPASVWYLLGRTVRRCPRAWCPFKGLSKRRIDLLFYRLTQLINLNCFAAR